MLDKNNNFKAFTVIMEQSGNITLEFHEILKEYFTIEELTEILGESVNGIREITNKLAKSLMSKMQEEIEGQV